MTESKVLETSQYLTFMLVDEVFALDVANVREILEYSSVTKVPRTPDFLLGIINVRGSVVPVVDMRIKLGLPASEPTVDTCIIVTEVSLEEETAIVGALVDAVQEVFELEAEMIEHPPRMGARWKTDFFKGLGKRDDSFIMILDIDKLISLEETAFINETWGATMNTIPDSNEQPDVHVD